MIALTRICGFLAVTAFPLLTLPADPPVSARLLRFPATNGKVVVFSYANDLYQVPIEGGLARRLTSHPGHESFPRFSPDGQSLAFTAQYDGNTEVYWMPAQGGEPHRLTYTATLARDDLSDRLGPNNIVLTWKNKSPAIVFRSRMQTGDSFNGQLYTVTVQGQLPEPLPVIRGGFCSFNADDSKMAYNRIFREFRTWKRYRGGMADDIWIYDFATEELVNITDHPASDLFPMWYGDQIYFSSDRTGRFNLHVYDIKKKSTRQLTNFTEYDVKFPSLGGGQIAFENGGEIYLFDLQTEKMAKIPVYFAEDFSSSRSTIVTVDKLLQSVSAAPDGRRTVVVARGEVFTVPAKYGEPRNLTRSSGVHERDAVWSPDGRWIAYLSDHSGENELWVQDQEGSSPPRRITHNADAYYYAPVWSPDSRKLLWSDNLLRLRYVDIDNGEVVEVAKGARDEFESYAWSPDSQWIAYARPNDAGFLQIRLYSVQTRTTTDATDGWYQSFSPSFSRDGKYLVFLSNRDFQPTFGFTDFTFSYVDQTRPYLLALAADTPSPLAPKSDEVVVEKKQAEPAPPKAGDNQQTGSEKENKPLAVQVELTGLADRLIALPIAPAAYERAVALENKLYYLRYFGQSGDWFRGDSEKKRTLCLFDFDKRKETILGPAETFEISHDNQKMLVKVGDAYSLIDLPVESLKTEEHLDFSRLKMTLDRSAEWAQIFHESWRQMRDFFYAPNLHGVNWARERERYAALLPFVRSRHDLTYLIGEMIGELNAGHAYVGGGERPERPIFKTGLLGAQLKKDPASGYFRIEKILSGDNSQPSLRSPLTEVGVQVSQGEYLIAIDGQDLSGIANPYALLVDLAGRQVRLSVNTRPTAQGARQLTVIPIEDEAGLYYYNWVQGNIEKVRQATNGEVGYIHIPDMGEDGLNWFARLYYPQIRKKALIVDVRENGGGFVSPLIIERLRREAIFFDYGRNRTVYPTDPAVIYGPMVCLINEWSASDGDIFPYRFRASKLGKLIGKRTWGGVVGIRNSLPFVDGGYLYKPEFTASQTIDGQPWPIEGVGVEPDIEVDNHPGREFRGEDAQLQRAIEEILREMQANPKVIPPLPPWPERSGVLR